MGSRSARYGRITVQQYGWVNAQAALRRAYREFPKPETVFVAGCSAGSVGSAFHADSIIRRYAKARVAQLGDSLAFVFHRPIRLTDWGAQEHFPRFFRIGKRRFTMVQFLTALARAHPARTFARFNHAADGVQERFYEAVGGKAGGFAPRLALAERTLKRLPSTARISRAASTTVPCRPKSSTRSASTASASETGSRILPRVAT